MDKWACVGYEAIFGRNSYVNEQQTEHDELCFEILIRFLLRWILNQMEVKPCPVLDFWALYGEGSNSVKS